MVYYFSLYFLLFACFKARFFCLSICSNATDLPTEYKIRCCTLGDMNTN